MRSLLLAIVFLIISTAVQSQPASVAFEKLGQIQTGRPLGNFSAITADGKILDNKTLSGKVSLILFWYPSLRFSNRKYDADYLKIDSLAALQNQYSDFQIISLLPDTIALALFQMQNSDVTTFRVGKVAFLAAARELSGGSGMPSCKLVDKAGIIVRSSALGRFLSQEAMADKVKDLMMPPSGAGH